MRCSIKRVLAAGFLMLLGIVGGVNIAAACDADCVIVTPPFCRRCKSVGHYTGITCQNFSSCGCFYTQNLCGQSSGAQGEDPLAALGLAVMEPKVCADGKASAADTDPAPAAS